MLANRIKSLTVRNYRSLGEVKVELDDLTILIGANGSGKSSFLDVLRFTSEALQRGLDAALIAHDRGGIGAVRRYSSKGRPYDVGISIELTLNGDEGFYEFTLGSVKRNEYTVKNEKCYLGFYGFETQQSELIESNIQQGIVVQERNLTLPLIGNIPELAPMYDFLTHMGFYSIFPNNLRPPQRPGNPYPLEEHGENLATVLREFVRDEHNFWRDDLYGSLARVVPGISTDNPIIVRQVGSYLVVRIKYEDGSIFDLALESDGTLRVLGLLTAIYQTPTLPLVGIEEPELFIHPLALATLNNIIEEASKRSQVILTTHSPDLISLFGATPLRIVERIEGVTHIGRVKEHQLAIINDQLFKGGDLLRIGGLEREQG